MNEPHPTFAPCPDCGEALHRDELDAHECDRARQFEMALGREVRAFQDQFGAWLGTPHGRFAAWLAARERR